MEENLPVAVHGGTPDGVKTKIVERLAHAVPPREGIFVEEPLVFQQRGDPVNSGLGELHRGAQIGEGDRRLIPGDMGENSESLDDWGMVNHSVIWNDLFQSMELDD